MKTIWNLMVWIFCRVRNFKLMPINCISIDLTNTNEWYIISDNKTWVWLFKSIVARSFKKCYRTIFFLILDLKICNYLFPEEVNFFANIWHGCNWPRFQCLETRPVTTPWLTYWCDTFRSMWAVTISFTSKAFSVTTNRTIFWAAPIWVCCAFRYTFDKSRS